MVSATSRPRPKASALRFSAGGHNDADDKEPGENKPDAGADPEGVQHGEQKDEEQGCTPDARQD